MTCVVLQSWDFRTFTKLYTWYILVYLEVLCEKLAQVPYSHIHISFNDIVDNLEQDIHGDLVPYPQVSAANDVCISATGKWEICPALGFALCDCWTRISAVSLIFRKDAFDTESDALDYCNDLLLEDFTNRGFDHHFDLFQICPDLKCCRNIIIERTTWKGTRRHNPSSK